MRFWSGPGRQKDARINVATAHFGSHFGPKLDEMASKKASKNRCRKSIENSCQNDTKRLPKWMPKSMKIHTFLKKAEMLETICFTIENVALGI